MDNTKEIKHTLALERVSSDKQFQDGSGLKYQTNLNEYHADTYGYKIEEHFPFIITSANQDAQKLDDEQHHVQQIINYCHNHPQ